MAIDTNTANYELVEELRRRGYAVAVFNHRDAPADYDYSSEDGASSWFEGVAERLEDTLAARGMDWLENMACNDGLPLLSDEEPPASDRTLEA